LWSMPPSQIVEAPLPVSPNLPVTVAAKVESAQVTITQVKPALKPQQPQSQQSLPSKVTVVAKPPPKYQATLAPITQRALPVAEKVTPTQTQSFTEPPLAVAQAVPSGELTIKHVELTSVEAAALLLKQGREQAKLGLVFKAQDSWRASLVALPSQHQARELLARSHVNQNNLTQALDLLARGIALFPQQWSHKLLAAKIHLHNQQPSQALLALDHPYRFNEVEVELLELAGSLAQQLQQWPQAQSNYSALISRDNSNHKWLLGLAIALDAQAKPAAILRYQQLLMLPNIEPVLIDYAKQRLSILQSRSRPPSANKSQ